MRHEWSFEEGMAHTLMILPRPEASPEEIQAALDPSQAAARFAAWQRLNRFTARAVLREINRSVTSRWQIPGSGGERELLDDVSRAFKAGLLIAIVVRSGLPSGLAPRKPEPPPTPEPPPPPKKTWVEFVLLDEEGVPVADEKYSAELPDGSVRNGSLGAEGKVRFDDIEDGTCWVSFPEIKVRPRPEGA